MLGIVVASHMQELTECIDSVLGGLPEWIRLLPPVDNVATYYKGSDIFLSPSRSEAFGYAVVEAAYCKTGIVLSRVGGQAALQIDGAYWFESENLDEFYNQTVLAIEQLNLPERVEQREATSQFVRQRYSLDRWRDEALALID